MLFTKRIREIIICFIIIFAALFAEISPVSVCAASVTDTKASDNTESDKKQTADVREADTSSGVLYLSDMPSFMKEQTAWGSILRDKDSNGALLSLMVNGSYVVFQKGIWAHAASTKEANYLKLYAKDNGGNGQAHSVWADARFVTEDFNDNATRTVEEYDQLIKEKYSAAGKINAELELLLLQRELVDNAGQYQLRTYVENNEEHRETLDWLMNNADILREYIIGGKPNGSYTDSLSVLSDLYHHYREDFKDPIYRKMLISLSLSHSKTVRFWINDRPMDANGTITTNTDPDSPNISDAVERYQIYKEMHSAGKLNNTIFDQLEVEEMRYIMSSDIPDGEIKWLRDYTEKKGNTNPYGYLKYTTKVSYWNPQYYSEENRQKWDDKYSFSKYGIGYKAYYPRLWIVFEEGGVCWQISNTGQNIQSAYGVPSTTVGQPGHVAYLIYSLDKNGNGMWNLWNDVGGWTQTNAAGYANHTSYYSIRWMNGWGGGSYASPYMGSYILLAQAAINDFEGYKKSEELLLLADTYSDDKAKLEQIYRDALKEQDINFDAWYGLVSLYANDSTRTEAELYNLAVEMTSSLKYYPLPMYDLLKILLSKVNSTEYHVQFTLLQTKVLKEAAGATDAQSIQAKVVKTMANYLLGQIDTEVAAFSFDGENAGVLKLASRYEASNVTWDYSLDGGNTWKQVTEHSIKLSEKELNSITAEQDIKVHIVGTNYEENNIYTIDILKGTLPANLYQNDWEDRLINATSAMEWRFSEGDEWTSYADEAPDLTGAKTVMVRLGATGVYLPSDTRSYQFEADNNPDTQKYIPISHLSVYQVSSEATGNNGHAVHAIDGDINTIWHTAYDGSDGERYIILKLDAPVYVSALEYVPRQSGSNGRLKNGVVSVSMDGENWTDAASITNWANDSSVKKVVFDESIQAQYVKLKATQNYGDGRDFLTALIINLYEDRTKKTVPTAEISYSTTVLTNHSVTATLVSEEELTITNNDGKDTYTFDNNGEFTFEFKDKYGNKGSATAKVDWIDKVPPVTSIEYSTQDPTEEEVTATLVSDKEIIITNNGGHNTYTFTENGVFEFTYHDLAGNTGQITAQVNWIKEKEEDPEPVNPDDGEIEEPKPDNNSINTNKNQSGTSARSSRRSTVNRNNANKNANSNASAAKDYQEYSIKGVAVKVLVSGSEKKLTLKKKLLTLDEALKAKVGSNSEYFELLLEDSESKVLVVNSDDVEITFDLDPNKKLLKVYAVDNDGNLTPLSYETVGESQIKVTTKGLGKYILSYEDETMQKEEKQEKEEVKPAGKVQKSQTKENDIKQIGLGVGIIGISLIVITAIGIVWYKKKKLN